MKWVRSIGVEFHPDWWAAVVDEGALAKDKAEARPPATPVLELKTKEQESLLKMVAGMAMACYGRQPAELQLDGLLDAFPLEWKSQRRELISVLHRTVGQDGRGQAQRNNRS